MIDGFSVSMAVALAGFAIGYFVCPKRLDEPYVPVICGLAAGYACYVAASIVVAAILVVGPLYLLWRYFRDMDEPMREAWQRFWTDAGMRVRWSRHRPNVNSAIDRMIRRRGALQEEINAFEQSDLRHNSQRALLAKRLYDELDLLDESLEDLL